MEIQLQKHVQKQLVASIQRYAAENLGGDIGELKASLLLRFCLEEIAPCVYNQAIADAQGFFQEKVADLENTCFAKEFGYWKDKSKPEVQRKAGFRP
jgi:uncharacterized protein (DUF2164 family)